MINDERTVLLGQVDASIKSTTTVQGYFVNMLVFTKNDLANLQKQYVALGTGLAGKSSREKVLISIAAEQSGIKMLNAFIGRLENQLKNLNGLKDSINKSFDNMIDNIKSMTYTYPNGDTFTNYYTANQPIDYVWV